MAMPRWLQSLFVKVLGASMVWCLRWLGDKVYPVLQRQNDITVDADRSLAEPILFHGTGPKCDVKLIVRNRSLIHLTRQSIQLVVSAGDTMLGQALIGLEGEIKPGEDAEILAWFSMNKYQVDKVKSLRGARFNICGRLYFATAAGHLVKPFKAPNCSAQVDALFGEDDPEELKRVFNESYHGATGESGEPRK